MFWGVVLIVIVFGSFLYFTLWYDRFQVKNISINGNQKINTNDLKTLIDKNITLKMLNFLSTKSIFLVNENNLKQHILDISPVIGQVKITKKYPQDINVEVKERQPVGIYCTLPDDPLQSNFKQCFYVDIEGVAFEQVYNMANDYPIVRQAVVRGDIFAGEEVIGKGIMSAVEKIEKALKSNYNIDMREAMVSTPIRLDVKTGENWQIYFNLDKKSDINLQITKLNLLLDSQITEEDRKKLEYIDLRFDRAYYK